MKGQPTHSDDRMQKQTVRKSKPIRLPPRRLLPWDVRTVFQLAGKHAPCILPGMMLQFVGQIPEPEIFALRWSSWDGHRLRITGSRNVLEKRISIPRSLQDYCDAAVPDAPDTLNARTEVASRVEYRIAPKQGVTVHPVLQEWLNATSPGPHGTPTSPILTVSRLEYRKKLQEILELAGILNPVKSPLREAGARRHFALVREDILSDCLGSKPHPLGTARYRGTRYEIWEIVLSGLTAKALIDNGGGVQDVAVDGGGDQGEYLILFYADGGMRIVEDPG